MGPIMEKRHENVNEASAPKPRKPPDRVRETMRLEHYSIRAEEAYIDWIIRFVLFHNKRHSKDMGPPEIETFLTHLWLLRSKCSAFDSELRIPCYPFSL
jgi:hypothetical protein